MIPRVFYTVFCTDHIQLSVTHIRAPSGHERFYSGISMGRQLLIDIYPHVGRP